MIWLLISFTGEYEDYQEDIHGYFDNEDLAQTTLNKIKEFDNLLYKRYKGNYFAGFQQRVYRKFNINAHVGYTGTDWKIVKVDKFDTTKYRGI